MGPTGPLVFLLLVGGFAALAAWSARTRRWWWKAVAGVAGFALAATFGVALVNAYYGYYTSWEALGSDLSGGPTATGVDLAAPPSGSAVSLLKVPAPARGKGKLLKAELAGATSGISRLGYVYLPPAYFDPAAATTRFPVVELFHGAPGKPTDWLTAMHVTDVLDAEVRAARAAPMVLVIPDTHGGPPRSEECVDALGGPQDDTYLSSDVPDDVAARLRVAPPGPQWVAMGFSTGGYCAANLALRHPTRYGGAAVFDGYFHSEERAYTGDLFRKHVDLRLANDPTYALQHTDPQPLPKFWMQVGTGDPEDTADAFAFHRLLETKEPTPLLVESGARHNYPSWERALPQALDWASSVATARAVRVAPGVSCVAPPPAALVTAPYELKVRRTRASPAPTASPSAPPPDPCAPAAPATHAHPPPARAPR